LFKESIIMSWNNIIHNKMRSFLTILGIVIGVASIIALITIVSGVTKSVTSKVANMGANKISIQAMGTPLKQGLSVNDIESIAAIDNVKGVSPTINGTSNIVYDKNVMEDISIQGKNQVHFANTEDLTDTGRGINILDCDSKNRVCLIGQDIKDKFFALQNPIDKKIVINGIEHTIIGTLQKSDRYSFGSNDNVVIIPFTTAMSILGVKNIRSADVYIKNGDLSKDTTTDIKTVLNTAFNYNDDGFSITNMQGILDTVAEMTGMMTLMLVGIASISLIVGGIGIMNMMLVTVTERTAEIGLRKALGAKPRKIQQQFLIESIFLSFIGGVVGFIFGALLAFLGCLAIGSSFNLSLFSVLLAVGFSVAIGLIFGVAPAQKASRLNPIDALRNA